MNLSDDLGVVKEIIDEKTISIIVIGGKKELKISAEKEEVKELKKIMEEEVVLVSFNRNIKHSVYLNLHLCDTYIEIIYVWINM